MISKDRFRQHCLDLSKAKIDPNRGNRQTSFAYAHDQNLPTDPETGMGKPVLAPTVFRAVLVDDLVQGTKAIDSISRVVGKTTLP